MVEIAVLVMQIATPMMVETAAPTLQLAATEMQTTTPTMVETAAPATQAAARAAEGPRATCRRPLRLLRHRCHQHGSAWRRLQRRHRAR